MKVVYVAGPFRGKTPWAVEQNVRSAEAVALAVAQAGDVPLCPHAMYRNYDRSLPDAFWLAATLELLSACDAMVLCPGWEKSQGTLAEIECAKRLGIPYTIFSTIAPAERA